MTLSLFEQALRYLARRAHSCEELRRKLERKASREAVDEVLNRLKKKKYLNDAEFAHVRARHCRSEKGWGDRRIRFDLKRLGVDAKIIDFTLDRLGEELPERQGLRRVIASSIKVSGSPKGVSQLKKLYDRCLRLGYPPEMVRSELGDYFGKIGWD